MQTETSGLHRGLNAFHLWGIAVGLVVSGEYFGWSYGWASAGVLVDLAAGRAVHEGGADTIPPPAPRTPPIRVMLQR